MTDSELYYWLFCSAALLIISVVGLVKAPRGSGEKAMWILVLLSSLFPPVAAIIMTIVFIVLAFCVLGWIIEKLKL